MPSFRRRLPFQDKRRHSMSLLVVSAKGTFGKIQPVLYSVPLVVGVTEPVYVLTKRTFDLHLIRQNGVGLGFG